MPHTTINIMKIILLTIVALFGVASCALFPQVELFSTRVLPRPTAVQTYNLPDGVELVVGPVKSTFSCANRIYGYYADTDNNCQIFHVCVPAVDSYGNNAPTIYSFFCGNQTVFDQATLVCTYPLDAVPCYESPQLYNVNENFGKTERPINVRT